jgi:hypothetical protein
MIYATPQQIEFIVINIDDEKETARLNLRVDEILPPLLKEEQEATKEYVHNVYSTNSLPSPMEMRRRAALVSRQRHSLPCLAGLCWSTCGAPSMART